MGRTICMAVGCLLGLSGLARAQEPTNWFLIPGSICQPTQDSRDRLTYSKLGAENTSSVRATVSCPLPTDHWLDEGLVTRVLVTGKNPTIDSVECIVTAANLDGNELWQGSASNFVSTDFVLRLDPNWIGLHDTYWEARCTLPARTSSGPALTSFWIGIVSN
jgi:hypothetical protein